MTTLPLRLLAVLFLLTACRVSAEELTHLWTSSAAPVVPQTVAFYEDLVIRLDDRLEKLEAVSVADGSLRWEHSLGTAQNLVTLVDGDQLYGFHQTFGSSDLTLWRFDLPSKTMLWEVEGRSRHGYPGTRLVSQGDQLAYTTRDRLILVNKDDGVLTQVGLLRSRTSPFPLAHAGSWIVGVDKTLEVRDAISGAVGAWSLETTLPEFSTPEPMPPLGAAGVVAHLIQGQQMRGLDELTGAQRWKRTDGDPVGTPASDETSFYIPSYEEGVLRLDAASGDTLGTYVLPEVRTQSRVVLLDDHVFVTAEEAITVFDRSTYEVVQTLPHGGQIFFGPGHVALLTPQNQMAVYALPGRALLEPYGEDEAFVGVSFERTWKWRSAEVAAAVTDVAIIEGPAWLTVSGWDETGIRFQGMPEEAAGESLVRIRVNVGGGQESESSFTLSVGASAEPRVLRVSSDRLLSPGETTELVVQAEGMEPLAYQWYRNGDVIASQTKAILPLSGDDVAATYEVEVGNFLGSVRSAAISVVAMEDKSDVWDHAGGGHGRTHFAATPFETAEHLPLWQETVRDNIESMVTDAGTLYWAGSREFRGAASVHAVNIHSGEERWVLPLPEIDTDRTSVSIALHEDTLYAWVVLEAGSGRLFRLDAYTGEILGERRLISFKGDGNPSLTVSDGGVFVFVRKIGLEVVGLDRETLEPLFPGRKVAEGIGADPVMAVSGESFYLAVDQRFEARSITTGQLEWSTSVGSDIVFPPLAAFFLAGSVQLDQDKALVSMENGLWCVDLVSRENVWAQRVSEGTRRSVFCWPDIYVGSQDTVLHLDARTGTELGSVPAPPAATFQPYLSSLVAMPQELLVSRGNLTAVWQRESLTHVRDIPFPSPIFGAGVLTGTTFSGGVSRLVAWVATSPPRVLNGVDPKAQVGVLYEHPLITGTRDEPPAERAEMLRGPDWLGLKRGDDGEWQLTGIPPADALGETLVVVRFVNEASEIYEWTHRVTTTASGPPVATIEGDTSNPLLGDRLKLHALIQGQRPVTVSWFRDGKAIPGADGESLFLSELDATDSGDYTVRAVNALGSTVSAPYEIVVRTGPIHWAAEAMDPGLVHAAPVAIPNALGEPLWSFVSQGDRAHPTAGFGMVFWASPAWDDLTLHAAVLGTGERLWSKQLAEGSVDGEATGVLVLEDQVIVAWKTYDGQKHVLALEPITGEEMWRRQIDYGLNGGAVMLVHEDAVYVVESKREQETARLVQLNRHTGESGRTIPLAGTFSSRPALARHGNTLSVLQGGLLEVIDLERGVRLWESTFAAWVGGWPRLAMTETTVVLQRGRGLEALDVSTGDLRWRLEDRESPFAIAGGYLYTEFLRIDLVTGEDEIFVGENLFTRAEWRFVSRDDLFVQDFDDRIHRVDLARPQVTAAFGINERPRAIAEPFLISQTQGSSSDVLPFQVRRMVGERITNTPPRAIAMGEAFSYTPEVVNADGVPLDDVRVEIVRGPSWLSVDDRSVVGTAPMESVAEPLLLQISVPGGARLFQPAPILVISPEPQILGVPESVRLQPGLPHALWLNAEGPGELQYEIYWQGRLIAEAKELPLTIPPLAESHSGAFELRVLSASGDVRMPVHLEVTWDKPASWSGDRFTLADQQWMKDVPEDVTLGRRGGPGLTKYHVIIMDHRVRAWSRKDGEPSWEVDTPVSTGVATHGRVVVYHEDRLAAYREDDGQLLWQTKVYPDDVDGLHRSAQLVLGAGGTLWLSGGRGNNASEPAALIGFDLSTGERTAFFEDWLDADSALLCDGRLLIGRYGNLVRCIDTHESKILWEDAGGFYPSALVHGLLFAAEDDAFTVRDARTGIQSWAIGGISGLPGFHEDSVFVTANSRMFRMNVWTGAITGHWTSFDRLRQALVIGDHVYAVGWRGGATVLDASTLEVVEELEGGEIVRTDGRGLVMADDRQVHFYGARSEPADSLLVALETSALTSDGEYRLQFKVEPNELYELQQSADLLHWSAADLPLRSETGVIDWQAPRTATQYFRARGIAP